MKIKDLLEPIGSLKGKIYTAYRIFNCNPKIKSAIKEWKINKDLPTVYINVRTSENSSFEISSYDLVDLYGFNELAALLMLDELEKVQERNDKERLEILISFLLYGRHRTRLLIPQSVFEDIKNNQPDVWKEYQKICDAEATKYHDLEKMYPRIVETDL
ncbi:MAG: hypothetical protein IKJ31_08105 [Bacteroidaceae bacterium]|nr:hypothetical protein [Bacteroidaceae bacterium]